MDDRPPISCYIRTCDSESRLTEVVTAAKRVAREVVIVDSGSKDRTLEIAASLGCRVVRQPWLGNGHQKRVGEEAAAHDWLLDLDSDEVLSEELAAEIFAAFRGGEPTEDVLRLPLTMVDPAGTVWRGYGVAMRAKVYDRRVLRQPADGAWDQLQLSSEHRVRDLSAPLLHHAFDDIAHLTAKQNRATTNRAAALPTRDRWRLAARVFAGFPFYFLKKYFLSGWCRAGVYGFVISFGCAHSRWLKDVKLWEKRLREEREAASDDSVEEFFREAA